jgi:hypothetical protein
MIIDAGLPTLRIFVWAINEAESLMKDLCSHLLHTSDMFGIDVELLGIGHKFIEHKQRLKILHKRLMRVDPDDIVLCMDGSDTLFTGTSFQIVERFLSMKTRVLISGEKSYTYQYHQFKKKFDSIPESYKYVNAGTFMGFAGDLLEMLEDIFIIDKTFSDANDQGLLGIWAHKNLENKELVRIDSSCEVFWVTTEDWYFLKQIAQQSGTIFHPNTGSKPLIIHNVGNGDKILNKTFQACYQNIIAERKIEHFKIIVISPLIEESEYHLWASKKNEIDVNQPMWDRQDHPNIITFYYGNHKEQSESVIPTNSVTDAIYIINEKYCYDYIVHVPKQCYYYSEQLLRYIMECYSEQQMKQRAGYDFPTDENFVYYQNKYFSFDGLLKADMDDSELVTEYEDYARKTIEFGILKDFKKNSPEFPRDVISLGGWCGPAIAANSLKVRVVAHPFCMLHSTVDCLYEVVKGNKEALFEDGVKTIMPHHNMDDPEEKSTMDKRLELFLKRLGNPKPILFVRTIINPECEKEIREMLSLIDFINKKYNRDDRYVFILHDQGIRTVKLARLKKNVMLWAAEGKVGWKVANRDTIFRSYCRIIRYALDEIKWIHDDQHIKYYQIRPHQSKQICKSIFDKE